MVEGNNANPSSQRRTPKGSKVRAISKRAPFLERDFQKNWSLLERAFIDIHERRNTSQLSLEVLYRAAYTLVVQKCGDRLYENVRHTIRKLLPKTFRDAKDPLTKFLSVWKHHTKCLIRFRDVLLYFDKYHAVEHKLPTVYELGVRELRDALLGSSTPLTGALIDLINSDRDGNQPNISNIPHTLAALVEIGPSASPAIFSAPEGVPELFWEDVIVPTDCATVFWQVFEGPFLVATAKYYSEKKYPEDDNAKYLSQVAADIESERERLSCYLPSLSGPSEQFREKVVRLIRTVLLDSEGIRKRLIWGADSQNTQDAAVHATGSLATWTQKGDVPLLKSLYQQYVLNDECMSDFRSALKLHLIRLNTPPNESMTIQSLLSLQGRIDHIMSGAFDNDKLLEISAQDAMKTIVNRVECVAKLLASEMHTVLKQLRKELRNGSSVVSVMEGTDAGRTFQNLLLLFRYVNDKDIFEQVYREHLSQRVLSFSGDRTSRDTLDSEDLERKVLGRLKQECGIGFTYKMDGIMNDTTVAKDLIADYKKAQPESRLLPTVLTESVWPFATKNRDPKRRHPKGLEEQCRMFEAFYETRYSGRRLSWRLSLGTADVRTLFTSRRKHELHVQTVQMLILLLFNRGEKWRYGNMLEELELPNSEEVQRQAMSLCVGKLAVLKRNKRSSQWIEKDDELTVNLAFAHETVKVKMPLIKMRTSQKSQPLDASGSKREPSDGQTTTNGSSVQSGLYVTDEYYTIEQARKLEVDAALVRVMKSRRRLDHNTLVSETTRLLANRFLPQPQLIKRRIEDLIEREFLMREPSDRSRYRYLA